jgi:hypothetical protein
MLIERRLAAPNAIHERDRSIAFARLLAKMRA